jgi:hypothetical protein
LITANLRKKPAEAQTKIYPSRILPEEKNIAYLFPLASFLS